MIDSTAAKAHSSDAGGKGGPMPKQSVAREVRRSTKIHGVVDGCGRPVALRITPEQRGGAPVAIPLLEPLPRTRLCAAETADDSDALRDFLATRGMQPVIPSNPTRKRIRPNFAEVKPDDLDWMHDLMELNYWGSVWPIHAALPYLAASSGRIVAVSSVAGLIGVPGRTAYSGTKFALSGFCEALRAELAQRHIRNDRLSGCRQNRHSQSWLRRKRCRSWNERRARG